jgi:Domain of unknown function (DUF1905)
MTSPATDAHAPFRFEAEVIDWRGPSPFFFAVIPEALTDEVRRITKLVSYGWGMTPVDVIVGGVEFQTSLFPKDDGYLLPLKAEVRRKTNVTAGDVIAVEMAIRPRTR